MRGGRAVALGAGMLLALQPALVSAQDEGLVPQSLWGVKHAVSLSAWQEILTNYGDRHFWEARPAGDGVRVGIIDTGIDATHPDLEGSLACAACWRDLVNGRPEPYDDNGHGTHVAGIIGGRGHFQANPLKAYFPTGARGIAPEVEFIVAKAMNATGGGDDERVAQAIRWVLDPDEDASTNDGAHVVHLSLAVTSRLSVTSKLVVAGGDTANAVRDAVEAGIFVVVSAGNQGREGPAPPGDLAGVISVGALDADGNLLSFSNRGAGVDIYAPGVIMSPWPTGLDHDGIDDGYTGLAGTSQAAPAVTGALALVLEANPALRGAGGATKVAFVEDLLVRTGQPVAGLSGARRLDADAMLRDQDHGTGDLAWFVLLGVGVVALVLGLLALKVTMGLLRRNAEKRAGDRKKEQTDLQAPIPTEPPRGPS